MSVEYRLAPETPYPGPLDDCYAGLAWTYEHADELGIDADRIGIAGVSAGGGLAAALALLARDRGEVPLAFQLLECPMIDDRQTTSSSQLDGLPVWSRDSNEFGWRSYLGDLYGTDDVPAYAAPARATDLVGLPAGAGDRRRRRRLPRRGHRLRAPAQPGRRAHRAARAARRAARRADVRRLGGRAPVGPDGDDVAGAPTAEMSRVRGVRARPRAASPSMTRPTSSALSVRSYRAAFAVARVTTTGCAAKPDPDVWSSLEYVVHLRDSVRYHGALTNRALKEDRPEFAAPDPDAIAQDQSYNDADLDDVLDSLDQQTARFATQGPTTS